MKDEINISTVPISMVNLLCQKDMKRRHMKIPRCGDFPQTTEELRGDGYYWGVFDCLTILKNHGIIKDFKTGSLEIIQHETNNEN